MRWTFACLITSACGSVRNTPPADLPPPPSCRDLAPDCGPHGDESCCASAEVTGGSFLRGNDAASDSTYKSTSYPAKVSSFQLDRFEVTVGRFRAFVDAGMGVASHAPPQGAGAHPSLNLSGWDSAWNSELATDTAALTTALSCDPADPRHTWTDVPGSRETSPINCVSWYEAMAFCIWDRGYLPTDAEWGYAASGGSDQRAYPWADPPGDTAIDCAHANYQTVETPPAYCVGAQGAVAAVGMHSPAGDGKWGQADLAGNVLEWTLDWLSTTPPLPCDDCATLAEPDPALRAPRGGGFFNGADVLRSAAPGRSVGKGATVSSIGFRCAHPTGAN